MINFRTWYILYYILYYYKINFMFPIIIIKAVRLKIIDEINWDLDSYFFSCRVEEFVSIVPRQPYRPPDRAQEVRLEFEAILLDVSRDVRKNQLWIHAKIKACVAAADCDQVRYFESFAILPFYHAAKWKEIGGC